MIYSLQSFTHGTQLWFVQVSHAHFKFSPWEENMAMILRASFFTLPLVTARFHSSLSKDATYHFSKQREKLPCLRTTSVFTDTKLKIYFQPPFPCPLISKTTLPSPSLWQAVPLGLSEHCSSEASANPQVHTTLIPVFRWFVSRWTFSCTGRHSSPAHAVSPCWKQHRAAQHQELTTFFPFFCSWTGHPNAWDPFELCSQIYSFCCSQMLSVTICTFCVLAFRREKVHNKL